MSTAREAARKAFPSGRMIRLDTHSTAQGRGLPLEIARHGFVLGHQVGAASAMGTPAERAEALAWIEECHDIHQQWIEHHDEHAADGETCEHAETAGDREWHVRCNERYDLVLRLLRGDS